jgi:RecA-family ATPase
LREAKVLTDKLKLFTIDQIEPEAVAWIWKPYIAIGKICLVQGDPGVGKSTSVLALAADVTNGAIPGESDIAEPSTVIYQNAEDIAKAVWICEAE